MAMDSNPQSSSCCPDHDHDHDHAHAHEHEHDHHQHGHQQAHQHSSSSSTSTSSSTSSSQQEGEKELSLEQASQLVRFNAFGDAFEDLAAAAVRGASMPHSHVGCWPAFSLFNHSCIPNTVHYVVGENMVVRATEDVPAGEGRRVVLLMRQCLIALHACTRHSSFHWLPGRLFNV
jgi:hypothetical protein